jgi:endonuclease/exonuclease/phosphatase family metal-dependent hydrolase
MKIATWNLEFLKTASSLEKRAKIVAILKEVNADIWILTETNASISPGDGYTAISSDPYKRKTGDHETIIWSSLALEKVQITQSSTSACARVQTPIGELYVYGTVIGPLGHPNQYIDEQIEDWRMISHLGTKSVCVAGDFNVQFGRPDNFKKMSKDKIVGYFSKAGITNLTCGIAENIDHIAISNRFLANAPQSESHIWNLGSWNVEQKLRAPQLSDHIGVSVTLVHPQVQ